jgi:ABC-2 type transport system ATP-binding protein
LIILDEPFSGLDPVNANLIKDEIYRLAQQGSTVIFSTHRMEQVEEICNHIVLVNLGKKILDGKVQDIKQQFKQHKFNIVFDSMPSNLLHSSFTVLQQNNYDFTLSIHDGFKSNDVLRFFIEQQVNVVAFNEILPSLNDIFIQLVESTHSAARRFQTVA